MGRPPTKIRYLEERRRLAGLIDEALKAGQRGDGTPKPRWYPWTDVEFAKVIRVQSATSVSAWRSRNDPERPGPAFMDNILKTFYGNIPAYADAKQEMLTAWKRAAGIDSEDPPDPRGITSKQFSEIAEVVTLLVNQPTPDNAGNLMVPYTLRLRCDDNVAIPIKVDGQKVTVTMDIGLTAPLFVVEADAWQPMQDTIFRQRKHPNTAPGPHGDSVRITGRVDNHGRIVDEPLEDVPHLMMERTGQDGDGPIALSVKVPRDGFSVTLSDGAPVSATQKDVLDAIFAEGIPRDSRNRLEVAKVVVVPGVAKPRP